MNSFDLTVLAILGLSMLLGVLRGLVKELMAIAGWIVAGLAAKMFAGSVAAAIPQTLQPEPLRWAAGFVVVLVMTLLGMWIVTWFVSRIVKATGLGIADRTLGAVFGLLRGGLVVLVGVLLAGMTSLPRQPDWRSARLSAPFEALAMAVQGWLPDAMKARIRYD
ncbi:MAG: CvpA family protein [Burkholderiales bacterium]|jgi:membrane protein required for colicin V production|nr:CvpA family protein [Burkholderiales bacterium]